MGDFEKYAGGTRRRRLRNLCPSIDGRPPALEGGRYGTRKTGEPEERVYLFYETDNPLLARMHRKIGFEEIGTWVVATISPACD
ncbi:MAG: hypothetical protein AB1374_08485 [Bacillota bacterium]